MPSSFSERSYIEKTGVAVASQSTEAKRPMTRPLASSAQCRAARALLKWSQADLAAAADVARKTVAAFETGHRALHHRTQRHITAALERAGVRFTGETGEGATLSLEPPSLLRPNPISITPP